MKNNTIAVLPFENLNDKTDYTFFSRGLADQIIQTLSKIVGLTVISSRSSFYLADQLSDYKKIGEALNAQVLLDGSVMLVGNKARINLKLIQVDGAEVLWVKTIDKSFVDVFKAQDEISVEVAERLQENFRHFEIEETTYEKYQMSFETYKKYLHGRYLIHKLDLKSTLEGVSVFKEVIATSPDFPYSYLDINQAYTYLGTIGSMKSMEAFMLAKPYFEKGIEIGAGLPESYLNMAWVSAYHHWNFKEAYTYLNTSLQLKQTDAAYISVSNLFYMEGKFDSAHYYIDKAIELNPLYAMTHHFKGYIHFHEEKYEQAIACCTTSLSYHSTLQFPFQTIGLSHLLMGEHQKALDYFLAIEDDFFDDFTKLGCVALCYVYMGEDEKANQIVQQLEAAMKSDFGGSAVYFLIQILVSQNKLDKALQQLELAVVNKIPTVLLLFNNPILKPIYENNQFIALKRQLFGLTEKVQLIKKEGDKKKLFTVEALQLHKDKLLQIIDEDKPYLQPELSLKTLSAFLDLSTNQMSYLLNEGFGMNFSEFINKYRLQAFKEMSANDKNKQLSILGMAYESGFSSKTVFNTFFKKAMGLTPKAYLEQLG